MPNKPTVVRTNSTPGSIKIVELKVLTFHELWDAYPDKEDPFVDPKTGKKPPYADNQCAIRLSMTMHNVGVEMKSFRGEGQIRIDGKRTALRAREMADWLRLRPFAGLPVPVEVTGPNWQDHIRGRTGIVYFSGYWARDTDSLGQHHRRSYRLVEQRHAYLTRSRRQGNLVPPVPRWDITSVVLRSRKIQTDSLLGNQVKRAAWSLAYLTTGSSRPGNRSCSLADWQADTPGR